jgi:hypothetical protein
MEAEVKFEYVENMDLGTLVRALIIEDGDIAHGPFLKEIHCEDGFSLSVQVHDLAGATPRRNPEVGAFYVSAEVGFPSSRPEPWDVWLNYAHNRGDFDPTSDNVFGWVPAHQIEALLDLHGGIAERVFV